MTVATVSAGSLVSAKQGREQRPRSPALNPHDMLAQATLSFCSNP